MPQIMPAIAGTVPTRFEKMPSTMAGKKLAAARPKANATTWLTKPGGKIPSRPATTTAKPMTTRPTTRRWPSAACGLITR